MNPVGRLFVSAEMLAGMSEVAERFPSLRGAPGVRPFDPERLDAWAVTTLPSEAGLDAARFVLALWGRKRVWRCGTFDLMTAVARWDMEHRAALVAWMHDPFML